MKCYQYGDLGEDESSIRLINLLPSVDSKSMLECNILRDRIDGLQAAYEALSYTWGDAGRSAEIKIENSAVQECVLSVTRNLETALRALRKADKPRTLWVDAICINQENEQEKSRQVNIMWDIYHAADCVVVWLGPEAGDSAMAMDSFGEELLDNDHYVGPDSGFVDLRTYPQRFGVQNLIERDWFHRVWVLQEVAAAKCITVACGDRALPGDDFCRGMQRVALTYRSFEPLLRRIRPVMELMRQDPTDSANKSASLVELIETFRTWNATKPVDKIYALRGISSDACAPELRPDYSLSRDVLGQRLVRFAFSECVVHQQLANNKVVFEIVGILLGTLKVCAVYTDYVSWSFGTEATSLPVAAFNPIVKKLFKSGWSVRVPNERTLRAGSSVVLLQGATRPTIITLHKDRQIVDMLATSEPVLEPSSSKAGWSAILPHLQFLFAGGIAVMKLTLCWDPFRQPSLAEVDRYFPAVNNVQTQFEARIQAFLDAAQKNGKYQHHSKTLVMLFTLYLEDEKAIEAETLRLQITIHQAAAVGYLGTVKLLLEANAAVDLETASGTTALQLAAAQGHASVVRALLIARANVNCTHECGFTPLRMAANNCHWEVCQMLLSAGADLDLIGSTKTTLLLWSAGKGRTTLVTALLRAGIDVNVGLDMAPVGNVTALHLAAQEGHESIVAILLDAGARVDPRTTMETTPLHRAAENGHFEVVKRLLTATADINAVDKNSRTPLDLAVCHGEQEVAKLLWQAGRLQEAQGHLDAWSGNQREKRKA